MGGVDKGWVELDGKPLIRYAIERFAPQVDELLISANRNIGRYAALACPVVSDTVDGFIGPLAGFHAAFGRARYDWLATCPCDSPWLPLDLVERLWTRCSAGAASAAVAHTAQGAHPVFALIHRDARDSLERYLGAGNRRVQEWFQSLRCIAVPFEDEAAFRNLNTPDDLPSR